MKKFKLTIAYDGTYYGGWQVQPNALTIQACVQGVLEKICGNHIPITGAGRTDAGVHAIGQTAHFSYDGKLEASRLLFSLNSLLPHDIRITQIEEVPPEFHARYSATGKKYHYHLHLDAIIDPFKRHYCTHVKNPIDLSILKDACQFFLGTHDFTSFANEAHRGSAARNAIRTLRRLDMVEETGGVRLEFEGNGFLYKMVRNIVGTLVEVAGGRIALEKIPAILKSKDRKKAGKTAQSKGLFLVEVLYTNQ